MQHGIDGTEHVQSFPDPRGLEGAKRNIQQLNSLLAAGQAIASPLELPRVLDAIVTHAIEALPDLDGVVLYLYDHNREVFQTPPITHGLYDNSALAEPVKPNSLAYRLMAQNEPYFAPQATIDTVAAGSFVERERVVSLCGIALRTNNHLFGVLYAFFRTQHQFTDAEKHLIHIFANQATIAIENAQLYAQAQNRALALETLRKTSLELTSHFEMPRLMELIIEHAVRLLKAKSGGLYLLDESGQGAKLVVPHNLSQDLTNKTLAINDDSVVGQAITKNDTVFVPNYRQWDKRQREYDNYNFTAVAGAPISWQDKIWGAITVRDTVEGRIFDEEALMILSHLGDLAAVVLENARRLDDMRRLLAGANDAIVIINEEGEVINFSRQAEAMFGYKLEEAMGKPATTFYADPNAAYRIKQLLIDEPDGRIHNYDIKIRTKQGESIRSQINASLLYDYEGKRAGSVGFFRDLRKMEQARKQIEQLNRLLAAEQQMALRYDMDELLALIVHNVETAIDDVDFVMLYRYDVTKDAFLLPIVSTGLMTDITTAQNVPYARLAHQLLSDEKPLFIQEAVQRLENDRAFALSEQVHALACAPLLAGAHRLGALVLGYRRDRHFSVAEKEIIDVLAKRAAIAIDNAQRYGQMRKRADTLQALYKAGQVVIGTLDLKEILSHIVEQAWYLIGLQGKKANVASIWLREGTKTRVVTAHPLDELAKTGEPLGTVIDLDSGRNGKIGIMGRTIRTRRPQLVNNVEQDPDYIRFHKKTCSELVVPITLGIDVFGVISIQSPEYEAFDRDDQNTLTSLASQAAIAIQNAQTLDQAKQQVNLQTISPFVTVGPASDRVFFGREQEMQTLAGKTDTYAFAIIGGRRIGKSSLLSRLHRMHLPFARFTSLYHDCANISSYEMFLQIPIDDDNWRHGPPTDAPRTFGELLRNPPTQQPFALLLDEADKMLTPDRNKGWPIFNALRTLANSGRARIILSGERGLREALKDPTSPLFNFAEEMTLGPLNYNDVHELVTQPMRQINVDLQDAEAIVEQIYDFTAGHPNVVQRLCARLIENISNHAQRGITVHDVQAVVEDPQFLRKDFLSTYWESATPLEKIISLVMVKDESIRTLRGIQQVLATQYQFRPKLQQIDQALQLLTELRSILIQTEFGYEFAVSAFPSVVKNTVTIDDMLDILTEDFQDGTSQ